MRKETWHFYQTRTTWQRPIGLSSRAVSGLPRVSDSSSCHIGETSIATYRDTKSRSAYDYSSRHKVSPRAAVRLAKKPLHTCRRPDRDTKSARAPVRLATETPTHTPPTEWTTRREKAREKITIGSAPALGVRAMLHGYSKGGDVSVSDTRRIRGYGYSDTPF